MRKFILCESCNGVGYVSTTPNNKRTPCSECGGVGKVVIIESTDGEIKRVKHLVE